MDRDRALFHELEEGRALPTLRLYAWKPWTISLGRHQKPEKALDLVELQKRGVHWVMRPTGGRAVFHAEEITYCVAAPTVGNFAETLAGTHRSIAGALLRFYKSLGVDAELTRPAPAADLDPRSPAPCFIAPGLAEIQVDGRKLAGSAQLRGQRAFLQHGSLPIGPAHLDLSEMLPGTDESRKKARILLAEKSITLSDLLPEPLIADDLFKTLAAAFAEEFAIHWQIADKE
jgi:lipoyl(octanoyl) transferase